MSFDIDEVLIGLAQAKRGGNIRSWYSGGNVPHCFICGTQLWSAYVEHETIIQHRETHREQARYLYDHGLRPLGSGQSERLRAIRNHSFVHYPLAANVAGCICLPAPLVAILDLAETELRRTLYRAASEPAFLEALYTAQAAGAAELMNFVVLQAEASF